eukprot:4058742-Amphidinium_carterae.1
MGIWVTCFIFCRMCCRIDDIEIELDIFYVYDVFDIHLLWGFLSQNFQLSTSVDGVDWTFRPQHGTEPSEAESPTTIHVAQD